MKVFSLSHLAVAIFLPLSFALSAGPVDLKKYCRFAYKKRVQSLHAIKNKGYYKTVLKKNFRSKRYRQKKIMYRGCRYDTPWIDKMYRSFCAQNKVQKNRDFLERASHIHIPKYLFFFFDGAGGFNALEGKRMLDPVNLDGSEGNDLGIGDMGGLNMMQDLLYTDPHALKNRQEYIEYHYHGSSGFFRRENYASAVACAQDSYYYLNLLTHLRSSALTPTPTEQTKWIVLGYSNGGALAAKFQNKMAKHGINMDLAITIDPVPQLFFYPYRKFKKYIGEKNIHTKRLINYYQKSDRDSILKLNIKGKLVKNADANILLTAQDINEDNNRKNNHIKITKSKKLRQLIKCELKNLMDPPLLKESAECLL